MNPIFSHPVMVFLVLLACCVSLAPFVNAEPCYEPIAKDSCELDDFLSASNAAIECKDSSIPSSSQPITYHLWSFKDLERQTTTSTFEKNPRYEYPGGRVEISHRIKSDCGRQNGTVKTYTFYCTEPYSMFEVDKDNGVAPLTVHITDRTRHQSSDVTFFEYRKNGVAFSTQRNPDITLNAPGTYTITQVVRKICNPVSPPASSSRTITVEPLKAEIIATYYVLAFGNTTTTTTTLTTTVTTTVTPTVTTTTVSPAPVVPVYVDTTARGSVPMTTAPITAQVTSTTQQAATAGASPAPSQAPGTPAPASPGTGTLSVATKPEGAQIYIDDVLRGMSPASIPELPSGQHMLRLEKAGYKNMTVPVSIGEAKVTEYSTSLEAESGGLGIVPVIAGVLVIAALGGGAYLYTRKKGPGTPEQK